MTDTLLRRCAVTFGCGAIALAAYTWLAPPRYRATAEVVTPQPETHVVAFSAVRSSPDGAAAAANSAARSYVHEAQAQVRARRAAAVTMAEHAREWQAGRVVTLERDLHDVVDRTVSDPAARAAWMRLAAQRDGARRVRRDLEAAQAQLSAVADPMATPLLMHDAMLTRQRLRLAGLEAQRAELASRYGPAHVEIQELDAEIARARADIRQLAQAIIASIGVAVDKARAREAVIQAQLAAAEATAEQASRAADQVSVARTAVARARTAYADRLRDEQALKADLASAASDARLITTAVPPAAPYRPAARGIPVLFTLAIVCLAAVPLGRRRDRRTAVEHAIAREMAAYARTERPVLVTPHPQHSHRHAA